MCEHGPQATGATDIDLHGLQEAFAGAARNALVGQQVEVLISWLDERKPHRFSASDARHLDGSLEPRASRRWSG
jgi:hypothetical protein